MIVGEYTKHVRDIAAYFGAPCTYTKYITLGSMEFIRLRDKGQIPDELIPKNGVGDLWLPMSGVVDTEFVDLCRMSDSWVRDIKLILRPYADLDEYHVRNCAHLAGIKRRLETNESGIGYADELHKDDKSRALHNRFYMTWKNDNLMIYIGTSEGMKVAPNLGGIYSYLQGSGYYVPGTIDMEYVTIKRLSEQ